MISCGPEAPTARLLIVARLGQTPNGEFWPVIADEFRGEFGRAFQDAAVPIYDESGVGSARRVLLALKGFSDLSAERVIDADPILARLMRLASSPPDTRAETWLAELETAVGDGKLLRRCRAALKRETEPGPPSNGFSVDDILEGTPVKGPASRAVDAFVGAMRDAPKTKRVRAGSDISRVQAMVKTAVLEAVMKGLAAPELSRLEATWRALRWVMEGAPRKSGLRLEVLDAGPKEALRLLAQGSPPDGLEGPDVVAFADGVRDVETLSAIAEFGASRSVLCLANDPREPSNEHLVEIRKTDAARWLSLIRGEVVVREEEHEGCRRWLFAPGVWALLRMLAESYAKTGSFARIVGERGSVQSPGVCRVTLGSTDVSIPTREFTSASVQAGLAEEGIIALGSRRNSDRIVLSAEPTLSSAEDAVSLPAQIWAGRLVRFSTWAARELGGLRAGEFSRQFQQAAEVHLHPRIGGVRVMADVVRGSLVVRGEFSPGVTLVPMQLELSLPLRAR